MFRLLFSKERMSRVWRLLSWRREDPALDAETMSDGEPGTSSENVNTTPVKPPRRIVTEIESYMILHGGTYSEWCVGVAFKPKDRLFNDHNLDENRDIWICQDCGTDTAAREVEDHFLKRGCDGGAGGGDHTSRHVYVYKKGWRTKP